MDQSNSNTEANTRQALVTQINQSTNILVTVATNPSVDQLAACLGLTLWLNKLDKHATAVFSGEIPSTLEFLKPAETLEKTTDSLRDFIVSLDKSKADKLRYKVEDNVVKIFITPYRTSLSADDLEFSQGDFNVDLVIALGVHNQDELDAAITAHGRILHDATVATITDGDQPSGLGSLGWHDSQASGLSELVVSLGNDLGREKLDEQIATALLTGVVAETERFSNNKTTPQVMSISAELMSAGANQQLVASKLDEASPLPAPSVASDEVFEQPESSDEQSDTSTLAISHDSEQPAPSVEPEETTQSAEDQEPEAPDTPADEADNQDAAPESPQEDSAEQPVLPTPTASPADPTLSDLGKELSSFKGEEDAAEEADPSPQPGGADWMPPQPWMNQEQSSGNQSEDTPTTDVSPDESTSQQSTTESPETPEPSQSPEPPQTIADIESQLAQSEGQAPEPTEAEPTNDTPQISVSSPAPDLQAEQPSSQPETDSAADNPELTSARDQVLQAIQNAPATPEPQAAPQAAEPTEQVAPGDFDPVALQASDYQSESPAQPAPSPAAPVDANAEVEQPFTMPLPNTPLSPPPANPIPPTSSQQDPSSPPPVPPPMTGFPPQQQ